MIVRPYPYGLNEGDTTLVVLGVLRGATVGLLIITSDGANGDIKNILPVGYTCGEDKLLNYV